jgi:4'-phosphopantetheinyl transferase EntD
VTEAGGAPFAPAFLVAHAWGFCAGVWLPRLRGTSNPPAAIADATLAQLAAGERAHAGTLAPARAVSWVGGRLALRAALGALIDAGVVAPESAGAAILPDDRGAPRLPAGVVGSISHKDGLAVALAGRDDGWRVGVDLEDRRPSRQDISSHVLDDGERAALASLDEPRRAIEVLIRFACKEAVYKALDPSLRRYICFTEVTTERDAAGLRARFVPRADEPRFSLEIDPAIDAIVASLGARILVAARARVSLRASAGTVQGGTR